MSYIVGFIFINADSIASLWDKYQPIAISHNTSAFLASEGGVPVLSGLGSGGGCCVLGTSQKPRRLGRLNDWTSSGNGVKRNCQGARGSPPGSSRVWSSDWEEVDIYKEAVRVEAT